MNQPSPQDLHEARLTAYALDELTGDERAEVERLLGAGSPEADAAVAEIARIREVGTQLGRELARELCDGSAPVLTPAQRAAISRAATPARRQHIMRWSLAAACAAFAAALVVVVLVPGGAPGTPVVARHAPGLPPRDAAEKDGSRRERAAAPTAAKPAAPSEAGKQEVQQLARARRDTRSTGDELANKREGTVAADQPARTLDRVQDAIAPVPPAAAARPVAAASGGAGARALAGEQQELVRADANAAPAALAALPPAAPPPLAAPAAAAPVAAAPAESALTAARLQQEEKATAADGLAEPSALGGPGAGAGNGRLAIAAAGLPGGRASAATLASADRVRYRQNAPAQERGALKSADKGGAAPSGAMPGTAPAGAPASVVAAAPPAPAAPLADAKKAVSTGDDAMMSTAIAATVQVPLRARTQTVDSLRRCLDAGRLPPPALVQVGELINAVPVDRFPQTMGPATIAIVAGHCPWQSDHRLVAIGFGAHEVVSSPRPPLNLVLVVDESAAMRGVDRLPLIKAGLVTLVRGLGGADRLSLVAYGPQARLVIDGARVQDAAAVLARIDGLTAAADAGGADAAAALALAVPALHRSRAAGASDEVVLCTAGMPAGDQALADQLRRLAADGVGVRLMAVGHDHPEDGACERLAAQGRGSFTYLASAAEAEAALGGISGLSEVVARQALAEVSFSQAEVASYRLLGAPPLPARPSGELAGGGELLAGQTVTLLFEIERSTPLAELRLRTAAKEGAADPDLVSVRLSYVLADGRPGTPIAARLGVAEAARQDAVSLEAAAAELGLALRHPDDPRYRWERMLAEAQADRTRGAWSYDGLIDLITRAAALPARGQGR